MKFKLFSVVFILISASSFATTENLKSVDRLGVQGDNAYFTVKEGFSQNCKWGNIYLNISTHFGKAAYANILSAKASGKKLSRIDYSQSADGEQCNLSLVEVRD